MRFQPGEPTKNLKALSQCEFQAKTILAYCSGNNLIIFAENQLIHTIYLPKDALAVDINNKTGAICVLLTESVLVYDYTKSFTRGDSWKLSASLPVVAEDCRWIDTLLLLVGSNLRLMNTSGEILWEKMIGSPKQAVVYDSQKFVLVEDDGRRLSVWYRVSQSAYGFEFEFIKLPCDIRWCKWNNDGLLFVWGADCVLRAFNNRQLVVSIQLPLVSPLILDQLVLYAYKSKLTVIRLRNRGDLIIPSYLWSNVPIDFDKIHKKFNLYDSLQIVVTQRDKISLTAHKQGELLTASIPLITPESTPPERFQFTFTGIYTGHIKSIKRICRSSQGDALFTQTRFTENIVWGSYKLPNGETTLDKKSVVDVKNPDCADLWDSSLVTVADSRLVLWDTSVPVAAQLASLQLPRTPMLLCCLTYNSSLHVLAVYSKTILMWRIKGSKLLPLEESNFGDNSTVLNASMVDPVGWTKTNDREALTTVSKENIQTWSLAIHGDQPAWTESSRLNLSEHKVAPGNILMKMSSKNKLAVAQNNRLFIWDAVNDVIEFDKTAENPINDLDWTTTPTGECLLGVGYSKCVAVYCQQRYDYTAKLEAWIPIRVLNIEDYTEHDIGDSIWLKNATFVIGAGNQLYIQDAQVNFEDERVRSLLRERNTIPEQRATLFDINAVLSGPLPVYHPQFLIQLIFSNRADLACDVLCILAHQMKYAPVEPHMVVLDYWLGMDVGTMHFKRTTESYRFNSSIASELEEQLKNKALAYLTRHQQMTLLSVVQSLAKIQNQSLDSNGSKFMLGYQLFRLHQKTQQGMNMRDFVWGSISNSKQVLLEEVKSAGATSSLEAFSSYGLMFWLENNVLVEQTEQLAKHVFAKTRDPVQVALLYLAMRKKTLLIGLWRVSSSHPEQAKTMKLLNNDFETGRWKSAALKNAYALMSKHRYEYAAALFLLGGSCKDAVNVLARQLKNLPLAFLVARVYEGDDGDSIKYIIERFLSGDQNPVEGDDIYSHKHWLKVWAYMTSGDLKNAVVSATVICSTSAKRSIIDPVLLWIYKELRGKYSLDICEETKVLERIFNIYCRMGCDLIALMASSEWKFERNASQALTPSTSVKETRESNVVPEASTRTTREGTSSTKINETAIENTVEAAAQAPQAAQFDLSAFGF